jgi:hypothetical protein
VPHVGHGLVGLAVGAATADDPRSPAMQRAWFGTAVLLAYLPDVVEWLLKLMGRPIQRSVPASLSACAVSCAVVFALLRWLCREKSRIVLLAALLAVVSHTVLDALSGGIPLAWPFSRRDFGPHWLCGDEGMETRLYHECRIFLPVLAAGLAVGILRYSRRTAAEYLAVIFAMATIGACVAGQLFVAGLIVCGLGGMALWCARRRLRLAHAWNLVPLAPVLLLAGVHVYAWDQMRRGRAWDEQGEPARALAHYEAVRALSPVDLDQIALYRTAECYHQLGDDHRARELYERGVQDAQQWPYFKLALAELYLDSGDADLRHPDLALRLADELAAEWRDGPYHEAAVRLRERARKALDSP